MYRNQAQQHVHDLQKKFDPENVNKNQQILLEQLMTSILENIKEYSTPYLLFLISRKKEKEKMNLLEKIFVGLLEIRKQLNLAEKEKEMYIIAYKIIDIIMELSPKFSLLKPLGQFQKLAFQNAPNLERQKVKGPPQEFTKIVQFVLDTKLNTDTRIDQRKLREIMNQILNYEVKYKSQNIFEEVALNWIKHFLDQLRLDRDLLCCKISFYCGQKLNYKTTYGDYFGISRASEKEGKEKEKLAQTITEFMNHEGGTIVVQFDPNKSIREVKNQISGISLEWGQKQKVLNFVKDCVNLIEPKHKGFQKQDNSLKLSHKFINKINQYVSLDFTTVCEEKTFQFIEKGKPRYICKIYVKMGHPRYYYYIDPYDKLTQIKFYVRPNNKKGKSIQANYDAIYKRLMDYQTYKEKQTVPERKQIHEGCIINMSMSLENFLLEENRSDDD